MIFDGKGFAEKIEQEVAKKVARLAVTPKIVSILVGNDPASELYTSLKQKAALRVGIDFEIERTEVPTTIDTLKKRLRLVSEGVTGVMIQMPIPGFSREEQEQVLMSIPLDKDVDGLRWSESGVMPATVSAILAIINDIEKTQNISIKNKKIVAVGTHGSIGKPLVHFLKQWGADQIAEVNSKEMRDASLPAQAGSLLAGDVVISSVGKAGLITGAMVRQGAIVIDVGISKVDGRIVGDMTQEVYQKASVAVAVPGGVGPVTVASLIRNAFNLGSQK